jgi:FtsZ-interacting cell division protein ZipA
VGIVVAIAAALAAGWRRRKREQSGPPTDPQDRTKVSRDQTGLPPDVGSRRP